MSPESALAELRRASEASLQAAPSSILAASTNRAVGASLHAAPSQEAGKESHDSNGEALEIVFDKEGDEAQEQTRELQAQLQAERMAVSRLRDEAQRSAEHIQALQAQLQAEREHIQALRAQMQAERAAVSQLEDEVQVCKAEAASAQQKIAELHPSTPRAEQASMQLRPDGDAQNKARITDLALNACDHVESEPGQLRDTRAWVAWLGDHLSPDMLHKQRPRVLAALLLHAAWCMEWGDGFPFAHCLVRIVEATQQGHTNGRPFPRLAALRAMRHLNLSAADCGKAAELHSKLLMSLAKSPPRGLPWKTQA